MDQRKYIVTGGGGFVGKALVLALLEQGHEVCSISRGHYPELEQSGAKCFRADLSKKTAELEEVFRGADAVFHVASKVDMWGRWEEFYNTNVKGTENVISCCRKAGVSKLIYTSSPSVIASGRDLENVNESQPYPERYDAFYPKSKAMAERMVLEANDKSSLNTLSLRPHLIWGPGDTNLIPTILERARAGRLPQIGAGKNLVDLTYIDDCVAAHLCAYDALENNPNASGRAYFISQGEPVNLWEFVAEVIERNGVPPIKKKIPASLALAFAGVLEFFSNIRPGKPEPLFTRFLASEMSTSHYFDIGAAREELGYKPQFSIAEAFDATFKK